MRRFASVFVKRDKKDKQQNKQNKQQSQPQTSASSRLLPPPSAPSPASSLSTPQLSIASDHASSSSNSLHSPNDDQLHLPKPAKKWSSWITPRRSTSFKHKPPPNLNIPPWPPNPDTTPTPHDDDISHDSYDPIFSPVDRNTQANHNLAVILRNSLVPPLPVSPFVQHNLGPFFPRSSNRPSLLSPQLDLRKQMLLSHLHARLPHLSPPELESITPFASRPTCALLSPHPKNFPDATHPVATHTKALPSSPGIRRWIRRPCFEDRYHVYLATHPDQAVLCLPVSAASMAVAALEYSEYIDVLIDPDFDQYPASPSSNTLEHSSFQPTPHPTQSHAPPTVEPAQPPPAQKRNSYTAAPSPLRNQHSPQPDASAPKTILKRNVRFAEDTSDPEDGLPLHVIRMKKKREQKADFLRQERLKRVQEEQEERQQQQLRARQEAIEREQREQRRQALEKERREKERAIYAETIAATRARRETHRAGAVVPLNNHPSSNLLAASPSFSSLKDVERNKSAESSRRFSRSPHDPPPSLSIPRRQSSGDSALHLNPHPQYDSSPGSSRPPSIGYSPVSPSSRPPSTYSAHTSSSEDLRHHGSRRNSMNAAAAVANNSSIYSRPPMIVSYPSWSGSNPNFQYIPPVPPFPDFVHDMPLLPPTAPFMKPSYKSRSPSSSSRSRKESYNSSSEKVNHISSSPAQTQPKPSSRPTPQRQSSASSLPRPTHHRTGSGESRNTSRTQSSQARPTPTTSHSHPSLSRGRPVHPQYLQAPSPWMPAVVPVPMMATPQQQQQMMMMQPQMVMVPAMYPNPYAQMGLAVSASNLHQFNAGGGGSTSNRGRSYRPVIS